MGSTGRISSIEGTLRPSHLSYPGPPVSSAERVKVSLMGQVQWGLPAPEPVGSLCMSLELSPVCSPFLRVLVATLEESLFGGSSGLPLPRSSDSIAVTGGCEPTDVGAANQA